MWDIATGAAKLAGESQKTVGQTTTKYCYASSQVIAEYEGSTLVRKFVYGPRIDEPICMIDVADGNTVYYYHFDGLDSVVALSNSSGEIVETYSYDVFGEPNRVSDVNNPYMFTGRRYDNETELYYYRARYYAPEIGRFLQTDPIGYAGGLNLYAYCGNNPLNWLDPFGLCEEGSNWGENWDLFWEWFFGDAPALREYGPESGRTHDLMNGVGTGLARQEFINTSVNEEYNQNNPFIYEYRFGLRGLLEAGLNPTVQFVGSEMIYIYPNPDGQTQTVIIVNRTSRRSFLYRLTPEHRNRPTGTWMGNSWQKYYWTEPLNTPGLTRGTFDYGLFEYIGP